LDAIEAKLTCIGAGPTLDYADASAFFAAHYLRICYPSDGVHR